jgi:PAS domain S-box-containing protein
MALDASRVGQRADRLRALKRGEERFRPLLEHSFEVIALLDRAGVILYTGPSTQQVLGYAPDELVGRNALELIHPDDREAIAASLASLLAEPGGSGAAEYRLRHQDGSWRWMEGAWANRLDDAAVGAIVGNSRDVTDRKALESNLSYLARASKLLSASLDFETIWRNLTELAVPHIADWCAVDVLNERGIFDIAAIAHRDPEKLALVKEYREANPIDMSAEFGLPVIVTTKRPEYIPLITDELLVAISKTERELEVVRSLGMTSALSVPLVVRDRGIGAITFVTSDSRRRLTAADVAMAEELAARTSLALENATLYAEARGAVALRDDFIAVASHELKTPITSLKMYTQVLGNQSARAGDERMSRLLGKMDAQTNKLTRLVNDLLDVSRMRHGRLEFYDEAFDLGEVVAEAIEHLRLTGEEREMRVEGEVARLVRGDRDRVGQVLTNLLTNALKFSPPSQPVVVRLTQGTEEATVSVRDSGIGIEAEHQQRLFERFYRVDDPDERTYPGLGIGLFIANEIVTRHGGVMRVASAGKGQGAEFSFTLPYERGTAGETDKGYH